MHGLKMSVFAEGSMKQDAAPDDGYETSVDPMELRTQGDSGKPPDMEPQQQQQSRTQAQHQSIHTPVPQIQQMQLVHHQLMVEQRLHSRVRGQEQDESDGMAQSPGSLDTRLSHDSLEGINSMSARLSHSSCDSHINNENHLSNMGRESQMSIESRMTPHESHMSSMEHISNIEKRIAGHEVHMNNMDLRLNSRMQSHDPHMSMDHMNGLGRDMSSMENRMIAHENHMNSLESRMASHEMNHPGMEAHGHMPGMGHHHSHENHMAAHMGHMNPHVHLQGMHHAHAHHLHHPHHAHLSHHPHLKCESMEDPYSFVDEDNSGIGPPMVAQQPRPSPILLQPVPKKRGRKKKIKPEDGLMEPTELLKKENGLLKPIKERKKHDRFNGMPEEEVVKRTLPDHLTPNLDIVIIGTNPGLYAAYKGHHYAGPGTHIWKCLYLSGLTPEPMTADDDYKLLQVGIGFTNMVARATKGSADLTRKEIKEGSQVLLEKLQKFKPKIAVFNGKLIYEVFSGNKDFHFGRQPDFVDGTNTYMWVMPSSSARCAQLPRAADKVPFYAALKKFRDYLNGLIADLDEAEVVFNDQKLKTFYECDVKGEHKDEHGNFFPYNRITGNEITDLSNSVAKKEPFDPNRPEKKKRGRPKKIRVEGEEPPPPKERVKKEKPPVDSDAPKKKRGRPKKIKTEDNGAPIVAQQNQQQQNQAPPPQQQQPLVPMQNGGGLNISEHTSSSNPASTCFSPPIQSPSGFCQGFSPAYASQSQGPGQVPFNPRSSPPTYHQSPHHPSPLPTQFSQSPPPASQSQSQSFTHSDLSSEISAAISSEHLGSPPPTSPSLGPPDFEPPTSMPDESAPMSAKDDGDPECRFPSPTPSESNTYQYRGFQDSEMEEHKSSGSQFPRQPSPEFQQKRPNQDVASKSLSGLESLVDQIPSIAENGSVAPVGSGGTGESFDSQQSGQYDEYLGGYPGPTPQSPYPHYTTSTNFSTAGYLPPTQSNFSVSSLANSSSHGHDSQVPSSFSVSSLASNYTPSGYPNLMGAPHLVVPQPGLFPSGMNMTPNYQYPGQYTSAPSSFPYSPHALHVPSPNYPPYSPYSNSSYPQPYLANHVLDRIKQERMDIGFGSF